MSTAFGKAMQPLRSLLGAAATEKPFKKTSLPDPPHCKRSLQLWDPPSLQEAALAQLEGGRSRNGALELSQGLKSIPERRERHPAGRSPTFYSRRD